MESTESSLESNQPTTLEPNKKNNRPSRYDKTKCDFYEPGGYRYRIKSSIIKRVYHTPVKLPVDLKRVLYSTEAAYVKKAMIENHGVITMAARSLGIKRTAFHSLLRKYGWEKRKQWR